ncbi:MAG TPA: tRNA pseudouridine(13) synthase TruD [archaeon]|nr:tRNA pseudouridine(13) synthase TruD [archaeon]
MVYWTKSRGTGGSLISEEDFIVEEIPLRKFFSKYARSDSGMKPVDGPYVLAMLKKKGMTTPDAIKIILKELKINRNDIGYAGLKDKFAVTSQYVTIRKESFRAIKTSKFELVYVSMINKMMQVGELEGNKFVITLHGCKKPENVEKTLQQLSNGLPNYFGPQRFGKNMDNHRIGKFILQRKNSEALDLINSQTKRRYVSLDSVDKKMLKFFIHAYQSYIFNQMVDEYVKKGKAFDMIPIVGYNTKLDSATKKFLDKDGLQTGNFEIRELSMKCEGSTRAAFIKPKILAYSIDGDTLRVEFELPKGSYATVLIREVTK